MYSNLRYRDIFFLYTTDNYEQQYNSKSILDIIYYTYLYLYYIVYLDTSSLYYFFFKYLLVIVYYLFSSVSEIN